MGFPWNSNSDFHARQILEVRSAWCEGKVWKDLASADKNRGPRDRTRGATCVQGSAWCIEHSTQLWESA